MIGVLPYRETEFLGNTIIAKRGGGMLPYKIAYIFQDGHLRFLSAS